MAEIVALFTSQLAVEPDTGVQEQLIAALAQYDDDPQATQALVAYAANEDYPEKLRLRAFEATATMKGDATNKLACAREILSQSASYLLTTPVMTYVINEAGASEIANSIIADHLGWGFIETGSAATNRTVRALRGRLVENVAEIASKDPEFRERVVGAVRATDAGERSMAVSVLSRRDAVSASDALVLLDDSNSSEQPKQGGFVIVPTGRDRDRANELVQALRQKLEYLDDLPDLDDAVHRAVSDALSLLGELEALIPAEFATVSEVRAAKVRGARSTANLGGSVRGIVLATSLFSNLVSGLANADKAVENLGALREGAVDAAYALDHLVAHVEPFFLSVD